MENLYGVCATGTHASHAARPALPRAQLLLSLVLLMTSLVLGDGVLTPAQSGQAARPCSEASHVPTAVILQGWAMLMNRRFSLVGLPMTACHGMVET